MTEWKTNEGRHYKVLPKEWFPQLLVHLLEAMRPTVSHNIVSRFQKCGIVPFNAGIVLSRVNRMAPEDDQQEIHCTVSDVVMARLSDISQSPATHAPRKKCISVQPGCRVSLKDLDPSSEEETDCDGVYGDTTNVDETDDNEDYDDTTNVDETNGNEADVDVATNLMCDDDNDGLN